MQVSDFEVKQADGTPESLAKYEGRVLLIVNTASKCGFTPQYEGLEALYKKYHDKGFDVLGVSLDRSKDDWLEAVKKDNLTWTQVSDLKYWQNDTPRNPTG